MALGVLMGGSKTGAEVGALQPAAHAPATFDDITSSAYNNAMWNNRFTSQMSGERMVQDELYAPFYEKHQLSESQIRQKSQQYLSLTTSEALGGRHAQNDREAMYAALAAELPDEQIPDMASITEQAAARASSYALQFQQDSNRALTTSPRVAAFLGEMGAVFMDPAQVAAIAASAPMAITARIGTTAAVEAGINLAIEAPLAAAQANWYEQQGRELTADQIANNLLFAAVFGGGLGGVMSGIYKGMGGTETRFFLGPPEYTKMVRAAEEEAYAVKPTMDAIRDMNSTDKPLHPPQFFGTATAYDMDASNPFKQTMTTPMTQIFSLTQDTDVILNPTMKNNLLGMADAQNYTYTKPMTWSIRDPNKLTGSGYDFTLNRLQRRLPGGKSPEEAHRVNMYEAVDNLLNGNVLDPVQRQALTMDITLADGPARITDVQSFKEAGTELSMKSKPYRQYVQKLIRNASVERLRQIAESVALPPRYKTPPRAPRKTLKQLAKDRAKNAKAKAELEETTSFKRAKRKYEDTVTAEIEWQDRYNQQWRAINRGEDISDAEIAALQAEGNKLAKEQKSARKALDAEEVKVTKNRAKLEKQTSDLMDIERQWNEWQNAEADALDYRAAIQAAQDIQTLEQGRIPKSLNDLRDQIINMHHSLQRDAEVLGRAQNDTYDAVMQQLGRRGTPFEPEKAFELDSVTRIQEARILKQEADAALAEAKRFDQSFKFSRVNDEGETVEITMAQALKEVDDLDAVIKAGKECML